MSIATEIGPDSSQETTPMQNNAPEKAPRQHLSKWALPAITIGAAILFSILEPSDFPTAGNAKAIALTQTELVVLALAELFVLVTGDFDLSIGGNAALGGILAAGLPSLQGLPMWPAIIVSVLACTAVGLLNGVLVNIVRINAFIATLSTGLILGGIATWYTGGSVIYSHIPQTMINFGSSDFLGIPKPVWLYIVLIVIAYYVLNHTPFGRFLYAVGGSREASRLSGLNVKRLSIAGFTISGLLCGVGGVIATAALGTGNPTVGPDYLLPAFAAVYLGATSFKVGVFNVFGTVLAVFAIAIGVTGLQGLGVPYYIEPVFNGVVLLVAVAASRRLRANAA